MKFTIMTGNIINEAGWADAIVNTANENLSYGGGLCGDIFRTAGKSLVSACNKLGKQKVTDCVITEGYNLPCKIIHAVSPRYNSFGDNNEKLLLETYKKVIKLAEENRVEKIAFPLISSGIYCYPLMIASSVAVGYLKNVNSSVIKEIRLLLKDEPYCLVCRELLRNNNC